MWSLYFSQSVGSAWITEASVFGVHMSVAAGTFDTVDPTRSGQQTRTLAATAVLPTSSLFFSAPEHSCGMMRLDLTSIVDLSGIPEVGRGSLGGPKVRSRHVLVGRFSPSGCVCVQDSVGNDEVYVFIEAKADEPLLSVSPTSFTMQANSVHTFTVAASLVDVDGSEQLTVSLFLPASLSALPLVAAKRAGDLFFGLKAPVATGDGQFMYRLADTEPPGNLLVTVRCLPKQYACRAFVGKLTNQTCASALCQLRR